MEWISIIFCSSFLAKLLFSTTDAKRSKFPGAHYTQQYRELSSTKTRSRAKRMMTNATKYYFHPRFSLCTIDKNTNHIQKKKKKKEKRESSTRYNLQGPNSQDVETNN